MRNKEFSIGSLVVPAIFGLSLTVLVMSAGVAAAQTETVIHTFQSSSKFDGSTPYSTLIADSQGALYGTTGQGGKYGFGSVFKLAPPTATGGPWREDILYSFTGGSDGAGPWFGGLLLKNGLLYGTTAHGGSANSGVVYELKPGNPWTETVLYSFTGGADGSTPSSGVISGDRGVLYGMTFDGGAKKDGAVYRLTPPAAGGRRMERIGSV